MRLVEPHSGAGMGQIRAHIVPHSVAQHFLDGSGGRESLVSLAFGIIRPVESGALSDLACLGLRIGQCNRTIRSGRATTACCQRAAWR